MFLCLATEMAQLLGKERFGDCFLSRELLTVDRKYFLVLQSLNNSPNCDFSIHLLGSAVDVGVPIQQVLQVGVFHT